MTITITENKQTILVFKTNISKQSQVKKLSSVLNKPEIINWNIDLEDCDKVLRIVTDGLTVDKIIYEVNQTGVYCAELE